VDMLEGKLGALKMHSSVLRQAPSEEVLFKNFDFFKDYTWSARFSGKFIRKFDDLPEKHQQLMIGYICHYLKGNIVYDSQHIKEVDGWPYMAFFKTKIHKKWLVWMVGVERIPELEKNEKHIKRFDYIHYMRFCDILKTQEKWAPDDIARQVLQEYKKDPARSDFSVDLEEKNTNAMRLFQKVQTLNGSDVDMTNIYNKTYTMYHHAVYLPTEFKHTYLTQREASSLVYSSKLNRWISESNLNMMEKSKYNLYNAKINAELLQKYADFQSAAKLVELLESIPNFKIRLTAEEKSVIGQPGNVLAIGRSGTGKTTCAILRLFSMEILFKIRLTQAKMRNEAILRDTRFSADDVDNNIGLHCVFVTASPVLTNEVCRYYHRLTDQIKEELKKKEERIRERKKKERAEAEQKHQEEEKAKAEGGAIIITEISDIIIDSQIK